MGLSQYPNQSLYWCRILKHASVSCVKSMLKPHCHLKSRETSNVAAWPLSSPTRISSSPGILMPIVTGGIKP